MPRPGPPKRSILGGPRCEFSLPLPGCPLHHSCLGWLHCRGARYQIWLVIYRVPPHTIFSESCVRRAHRSDPSVIRTVSRSLRYQIQTFRISCWVGRSRPAPQSHSSPRSLRSVGSMVFSDIRLFFGRVVLFLGICHHVLTPLVLPV